MLKSKYLLIFLFIFVSTQFVASQEYFGFDLNCFQGCDGEKSNINQQVILELTLKNNFEYWIKIGKESNNQYNSFLSNRLTIENSNLNDGKIIEDHKLLSYPIYISPKSEIKLYFPLNAYNDLEKEKRVGEWKITPEISLSSVSYYANPFDEDKNINIKTEYKIPSTLVNKQLKFQAENTDVRITTNPFSKPIDGIKDWFKKYFGWIIATIIAGVSIYFFTKKKRK